MDSGHCLLLLSGPFVSEKGQIKQATPAWAIIQDLEITQSKSIVTFPKTDIWLSIQLK